MSLQHHDPVIFSLIKKEQDRQAGTLSLIASENIVSHNILQAVGSSFTNKYAECYPQRRYYGGCEYNDELELIAIERVKKLFAAQHANVQPHCGSSANLIAFFALANYGDTVLAMNLDHGGHLTHGSKVNFSGKFFNIVSYGVSPDTFLIDYNEVMRLAEKHKPKIIIAGASAYSRQIDFAKFGEIARSVGAKLLVDMAHIAGLIAAGLHNSPIEHADIVTSTTHKTLRGPRGGLILCKEEFKKAVDASVFPGFQGGPLMHEIAGKATCFKDALSPSFKTYQAQVIKNAQALAGKLQNFGFSVLTGGTDNHMLLIDLRDKNITGKDAESLLNSIGLVVNKNKVPFDPSSPTITGGIRLGTPAVTTRGMTEVQMTQIAELINACLNKSKPFDVLKAEVTQLAKNFNI